MYVSNWLSATKDFKEYVIYLHVLNWNYKLISVEFVCKMLLIFPYTCLKPANEKMITVKIIISLNCDTYNFLKRNM